jgi:hypothetical protein
MILLLKVFNGEMESTRNGMRFRLKFNGLAQIQNQEIFTLIKPLFDLLRSDSRDGEPTKEPLALKILPYDIGGQTHRNKQPHPRTHAAGPDGQIPKLVPKFVSYENENAHPEECSQTVQQKKPERM